MKKLTLRYFAKQAYVTAMRTGRYTFLYTTAQGVPLQAEVDSVEGYVHLFYDEGHGVEAHSVEIKESWL